MFTISQSQKHTCACQDISWHCGIYGASAHLLDQLTSTTPLPWRSCILIASSKYTTEPLLIYINCTISKFFLKITSCSLSWRGNLPYENLEKYDYLKCILRNDLSERYFIRRIQILNSANSAIITNLCCVLVKLH